MDIIAMAAGKAMAEDVVAVEAAAVEVVVVVAAAAVVGKDTHHINNCLFSKL